MAVLEAIFLSAFVILVATQLDPGSTIILLSGVFAFTGIHGVCRYRNQNCLGCRDQDQNGAQRQGSDSEEDILATHSRREWWRNCQHLIDHEVVKFLGALFQLSGLVGTAIAVVVLRTQHPVEGSQSDYQVYLAAGFIIVSCLPLSVLWSYLVQTSIFRSNEAPLAGIQNRGVEGRPAYPASYKGG